MSEAATAVPSTDEGAATARAVDEPSVLDLTTELSPTKKIRIDDEEYDLLNFDHLNPEQEASVTAMFARFQKVYGRLEVAKNDSAATSEALKLRQYREALIVLMTTVPKDLVKRLSAAKQGKLLGAIQDEIGAEIDVEDEGDGVVDPLADD